MSDCVYVSGVVVQCLLWLGSKKGKKQFAPLSQEFSAFFTCTRLLPSMYECDDKKNLNYKIFFLIILFFA